MTDPTKLVYNGPWDATNYEIVKFLNERDIHFSGARIDGQRDRMTGGGEWGHGVYLANIDGGLLEDLWIENVHGDGIVFGSTHPRNGDLIYGTTRDVIAREITVMRARRCAVSFIGAEHCTLEDASLVGTRGTDPACGIDWEPDHGLTPNVANRLIRVDIAHCQKYAMICDKGGPTTFGTRVSESRFIAEPEGWAMWWTGARSEEHPWHTFTNTDFFGPVVHLHHCRFVNCNFFSMSGNQQSEKAIHVDNDMPLRFEGCEIDGEPLKRDHPKVFIHGDNKEIV